MITGANAIIFGALFLILGAKAIIFGALFLLLGAKAIIFNTSLLGHYFLKKIVVFFRLIF